MEKLLIVVDYQNDFVTGSLGFPKASKIENNIYNKVKSYQDKNYDVIFTLDTHYHNHDYNDEDRKLKIKNYENDNSGWDIYGKVEQLKNNETLEFSKFTFGSIDMAKFLLGKDYDSVELVGVTTDVCVISNAILVKSALPETEIIIDALCVASNNQSMEQKAFDLMENLKMKIINR
ncbi:cysteine hydrolase family protein [Anaerovorax odorimutans]|uniref:cysteine hydrolase family protein n=1 Tax=Anaerovorax odorimutans TaxID=109327 RepID=UPI0004283E6B|nr:isochorismatase family protein [Anaerovorax odorimutans]